MKMLIITVAIVLLLIGCAPSKKVAFASTDNTLSSRALRHLTIDDSVTLLRLGAINIEHPKIILCRRTRSDTLVAVIEAAQIVARDSAVYAEKTVVADSASVASDAQTATRTESRRTPYPNTLWIALALLAGLLIGRSFRGTGSRQ